MKRAQSTVFMSYSHADARFAKRLTKALMEASVGLWIDQNELKAGDSLVGRIEVAIATAELFIVLLSKTSIDSPWVNMELQSALTHQLRGKERFVIPLTIDDCRVPLFLDSFVRIDFSNRRQFKTSVAKLLRSLDTASAQDIDEAALISDPGEGVLSRIAADSDLGQSKWFDEYKDLPLVRLCQQAFTLGAYGGAFREDLKLAVEMASNQVGAIEANNLAALMGFFTDLPKQPPFPPDVVALTRILTEDPYIGVDYRWFTLPRLISFCQKLQDRQERFNALPVIFPARGNDPLSDRLITEHFNGESTKLADLWQLGSSYYREEIIKYICRVSRWRSKPMVTEPVLLNDDLRDVTKNRMKGWVAISINTPVDQNCIERLLVAKVADALPPVASIVEQCEYLSAEGNAAINVSRMLDVVDREFIRRIGISAGTRYCYQLLVQLTASPNIDVIVSYVAFGALVHEFRGHSLRFDDRFPGCLMRKKIAGMLGPMSVVQALAAELADDETSTWPLLVLVELTRVFESPAFLASISIALKERSFNNHLKMAYDLVHGAISAEDVLRYVTQQGVD